MDNSHSLTDNNLSSPKLRIFLTFFATFLALTSLIGLYTTTDFGSVIILIIFAIPSIFGGFLGGLLGNVVLRKRNNDTAKINWSSFFWLIFGPLWGFDIYCAILILFSTLFIYISMFSIAISTLGLISALVLLSTPVILFIFTALPAILVTYLTLSTEHVSYTDNLLKKFSPKLNSQFVVGIIILTFASCYLSIAAMIIPYELIIGDDQHDTLYNEADWRKLPQPPRSVNKLVSAFPYEVYIETISGELFGCQWSSKYDMDCWYPVDKIPEPITLPCTEHDQRLSPNDGLTGEDVLAVDFPENKSISQFLRVEYCDFVGRERSRSEFQYVLTSNEEVWQWGFDRFNLSDTPSLDRVERIIYGFGLLFIILFWIIGILVLMRYRLVSRN